MKNYLMMVPLGLVMLGLCYFMIKSLGFGGFLWCIFTTVAITGSVILFSIGLSGLSGCTRRNIVEPYPVPEALLRVVVDTGTVQDAWEKKVDPENIVDWEEIK